VAWEIERDLEARSWCELHGVRVPNLVEHPSGSDWAMVEDLGSADAEFALRSSAPGERLALTVRLSEPLCTLSLIDPASLPAWNPPLDRARLRWELAGFELWFLRHRCAVRPPSDVSTWLDDLAADVDHHPKRICHRDYHINNLFFLDNGGVGVIDFQDLLVGPDTYDIVSLLNERSLPELLDESERAAVLEHWARATSLESGWTDRARSVRLQRALKVLGTFARFEAAGSPSYAPWMIALAREVAPELRAAGAPPDLTDLLLDC
jgi:hypothetical protein